MDNPLLIDLRTGETCVGFYSVADDAVYVFPSAEGPCAANRFELAEMDPLAYPPRFVRADLWDGLKIQ